ncbi:MAG TPA: chorismate-binding protein [Streptosporangiaceae bacterium]|jgi:para-aminobenzoate synthetase
MRVLLIDNHDSFTRNLFALLAVVNGAEPVVVTSDPAGLRGVDPAGFDAVVISPGPGHPGRPRDFGHAAQVVESVSVPLLGVCLGHQGIALGAGAMVGPAPQPRHGYLSRIEHDGKGLFRGLPQGFTAVRYHSLCVADPVPETLEVTARAEDGVIMGLRHRDRPQWGVQFHPESVRTSLGHELLANFRDLTREFHATQPRSHVSLAKPAAHGGRTSFTPGPAASQPPRFEVAVHELDGGIDAEAAFTRLFAGSDWAFWLDSARTGPGGGQFSFLGDGGGPHAERVTCRAGSGVTSVQAGPGGPVRWHRGSVFDYLRRQLPRRDVAAPALPFGFCGGYVGYLGYEARADCGVPTPHRARTPDACWLFADRMLAVDHERQQAWLIALHDRDQSDAQAATDWLRQTAAALTALPRPVTASGPPPRLPPACPDEAERWLVRPRGQYLADIAACRRALMAGESYEICLTNALLLPAAGEGDGGGFRFYRRLRRINPAPYAAYLRFGGVQVACSSPEQFLAIGADGMAEAKPIKGTAPRGHTPHEDAQAAAALAADPKNLAENLIVTDLLRNDLGRTCQPGSVHVPHLASIQTCPGVHHLVSVIRGQLRESAGAVDCLQACFPGGSMTGAPKLRTMQILDELEGQARGVYSGTLGYLSCTGRADLSIVIRTAVQADGYWHVGAGGAIILGSDPDTEYREMLLKAAPLLHTWQAGQVTTG